MGNVQRPSGPQLPHYQQADAATLFGGIGLVASVLGAFALISASGWFGAGLLLFAILAFVVMGFSASAAKDQKLRFPEVLILLSAAASIWAPLLLSASHILPFVASGWIVEGLFLAGLAFGAWDNLKGIGKLIAALLGLSLAVALMILPSPKAFDDPSKEADKWRVALSVRDDQGAPIAQALGQCIAVAPWDVKPANIDPAKARRSDAKGEFDPWEFTEDPKLKTVLCFVLKEASEDNAGYPLRMAPTAHIIRGLTYPVEIELTENPHPDMAFLQIDAQADTQSAWTQLSFELWDGEPAASYGADGPNLIARKWWNLYVDGAFQLNAQYAGADLYLRSVYSDDSSSVQKLFHIGSIAAGGRKKVVIVVK